MPISRNFTFLIKFVISFFISFLFLVLSTLSRFQVYQSSNVLWLLQSLQVYTNAASPTSASKINNCVEIFANNHFKKKTFKNHYHIVSLFYAYSTPLYYFNKILHFILFLVLSTLSRFQVYQSSKSFMPITVTSINN